MTTGMIYIVDDNAETAQSLAFFLESLGWRTRVWNDPEAFLNDYEAHLRLTDASSLIFGCRGLTD